MDITIYFLIGSALAAVLFLLYSNWMNKKENERQRKIQQIVKGGESFHYSSNITIPINRTENKKRTETRFESSTPPPSSDDGFLTSMMIAQATDSTILGTIIGGNLTGAIIGDSLNNNDDHKSNENLFNNDSSSSYDSGSSYDSSDSSSSYDSGSSFDSSDSSW